MITRSIQRGLRIGAIAFGILAYLILIGVPIRLGELAMPVLSIAMALYFWLSLRGGASKQDVSARAPAPLFTAGLIAGLTAGALTAALIAYFAGLLVDGVRLQPIFDKIVPPNLAALYGIGPGALVTEGIPALGWLRQVIFLTVAGLVGAALVLVERSIRRRTFPRIPALRWIPLLLPFVLLAFVIWLGMPGVNFGGNNKGTIRLLAAMVTIGSGIFALRAARPGREQRILGLLFMLGLVYLPFTLDQFQNSVMGIVFIFVMIGLGLNIVVGFAGLLDLGYVAFFAIGAYVYAFLAAPFSSPLITQLLQNWGIPANQPLVSFWMAIPITMIAAGIGGVMLGIPVLRLRGDYLAIVTLGFGEIIRLFMLNLSDLTNGPRGLLNIAPPYLFGVSFGSPREIFILALLGAGVIAFTAYRLDGSRLGRAWVAMREDEDVAQATGVNLVRTKLLAFAIGALFAGLAGQLYAARQINIFPENFSLFVSIDALSLVIVGGMGSIPGVVIGALALKGLPEVLRGVDEYRIVTFAVLLMVMMIVRPEGLVPSTRRRRELHDDAEPAPSEDAPSALEQLSAVESAAASQKGGRA
jgi:branched-chain amino acid transport system permease protein